MFSLEESDFIRALAGDYRAVRSEQLQMNAAPLINRATIDSDERRIVGTTDYQKFEEIEKSIEQEAAHLKWKEVEESAAKWCKIDHVHGPNCKAPMMGCSHDHNEERKVFEKSFDDKLKAIRLFRDEGNSLYSTKEYSRAITAYRNALVYLDYSFGDTDSQDDTLDEERYKCHINLAASWLELEEYHNVVQETRLALGLKQNSIKALFRRGVAHTKLGNFNEARQDLLKAKQLSLAEHNEARISIHNAIEELDKQLTEYKHRSKQLAVASLDLE